MDNNEDYENEIDLNIDDLDTNWINEFNNIDNTYKMYYTEDITFIKVYIIYVNLNNEIEKIKEEKVLLSAPSFLSKEELLQLIKNNNVSNQIKYSLLSILKFDINLEPQNLKTFLKNKNPNIGSRFINSINVIDTIKFDKSISMFHDINQLFITMKEKNTIKDNSKKPFTKRASNYKKNKTKKLN